MRRQRLRSMKYAKPINLIAKSSPPSVTWKFRSVYRVALAAYRKEITQAILEHDPTLAPLLERQAELVKLEWQRANEGEAVADSDSSGNSAMKPSTMNPVCRAFS